MANLNWLFGWAENNGIEIPKDSKGKTDINKLFELYKEHTGGVRNFRVNTDYSDIIAADKASDTVQLNDETMPRSLGARWANEDIKMPNGKIAHFVEGSKLHHKEVFAGKGTKTPIRDVERLVNKYGGKADNWQKVKGFGTFELNGKSFEGEIHWYEESSVGRKEIKFKER